MNPPQQTRPNSRIVIRPRSLRCSVAIAQNKSARRDEPAGRARTNVRAY